MSLDALVSIWKHIGMNRLEIIRLKMGLSFAAIGRLIGVGRDVAWKHCHSDSVPAEAAIKYSAALGIPFSALRPDLPTPVTRPEAQEEPRP